MVAKGPVSVGWQIVFCFISPLNIWAFYRIKKLTKAAIYVFIPSFLIQLPLTIQSFEMAFNPSVLVESNQIPSYDPMLYTFSVISSLGFLAFEIYLMVKWAREWNSKFEEQQ